MSNEKPTKCTAFYRSTGDVRNLKLRIRIREGESHDIEAYPEEGWRTRTFTWQVKHFSTIEKDFYGDVNNCLTDIEKIYNERITNGSEEDEEDEEGGITMFTYVNDEGYVAEHETVRSSYKSYLEKFTGLENEEITLQSYDDYHESLCKSMLQPTLVENSEKMHILADFGEHVDDVWMSNERLLCTVKYDKTSQLLSIHPDFTTTQPYSMRIQGESIRHIFYYIENASELGRESDVLREDRIEQVNQTICEEFTLPPKDRMFAYVFFEILTGEGFENDDTFVRYTFDLNQDWTCDNPDVLTGITQRCKSNHKDGLTNYGHQFDVVLQYDLQNFQENSAPKNPQVYFEVISRGTWDRYTTEGLSYLALPISKPGCYTERLSCIRITSNGPSGDLRRFFIGDHPNYDDVKWMGLPETAVINKYNVDTVGTGWLKVRFNILCQSQAFLHEFSERDQKEKLIYEKLNSSSLIRSVNQVLLAFKKAKKNLADVRKDVLREEK